MRKQTKHDNPPVNDPKFQKPVPEQPLKKGPGRIEPKPKQDTVQEASEESFPASDPPARTGVTHT